MRELKEIFKECISATSNRIDQILIIADKSQDLDLLNKAAFAIVSSINEMEKFIDYIDRKDNGITADKLTEMAVLADAFDESGDPLLIRQASVIDEILLTIGASKETVAAAKRASDIELEKLRAQQPPGKDPYKIVKEEHDKDNGVEEARKLIADAVKEYRPLEAGLSTRTCVDHPGALMSRIGDNIYQCSLDKGIYNYQAGFTDMKGNKIPGGDVSNQTQSLHDRPNEQTSFDTRESRLNNI